METIVGPPARTWESTRGSIATWAPARGLYVTRMVGHVDVELANRMIASGNDIIARDGTLMGFHHWAGVTGYDSACRTKLTDWGFTTRNNIERVHFLITSKLVRMGVTVASIVLLGMIVSHDEAGSFEAQLQAELDTRRKSPARPRRPSGFGGGML